MKKLNLQPIKLATGAFHLLFQISNWGVMLHPQPCGQDVSENLAIPKNIGVLLEHVTQDSAAAAPNVKDHDIAGSKRRE
ncbi:MAG: hypothetical protein H6664_08320 [Ardenticatenaceae bacterium]|nr:hypothetical protein [Ardenticatenaceae bacterium]